MSTWKLAGPSFDASNELLRDVRRPAVELVIAENEHVKTRSAEATNLGLARRSQVHLHDEVGSGLERPRHPVRDPSPDDLDVLWLLIEELLGDSAQSGFELLDLSVGTLPFLNETSVIGHGQNIFSEVCEAGNR